MRYEWPLSCCMLYAVCACVTAPKVLRKMCVRSIPSHTRYEIRRSVYLFHRHRSTANTAKLIPLAALTDIEQPFSFRLNSVGRRRHHHRHTGHIYCFRRRFRLRLDVGSMAHCRIICAYLSVTRIVCVSPAACNGHFRLLCDLRPP